MGVEPNECPDFVPQPHIHQSHGAVAIYGGATFISNGTQDSKVHFSENQSLNKGGAIYNGHWVGPEDDKSYSFSKADVSNSIFSGNIAGQIDASGIVQNG